LPFSLNEFQVLDALDSAEITSQRQLAEHTGISLGQINYVLKRLLEKGMVKVGNFKRNPKKIGYSYLLTPKGIEEKSRLAVRFVLRKLAEYNRLQERVAERLAAIDEETPKRVVFVGPKVIREFVEAVVDTRDFNLEVVERLEEPGRLSKLTPAAYDAVLLFDERTGGVAKVAADTGIPKEKLHQLW
jgi:EPS-associated MarR family transcriptional regulator